MKINRRGAIKRIGLALPAIAAAPALIASVPEPKPKFDTHPGPIWALAGRPKTFKSRLAINWAYQLRGLKPTTIASLKEEENGLYVGDFFSLIAAIDLDTEGQPVSKLGAQYFYSSDWVIWIDAHGYFDPPPQPASLREWWVGHTVRDRFDIHPKWITWLSGDNCFRVYTELGCSRIRRPQPYLVRPWRVK